MAQNDPDAPMPAPSQWYVELLGNSNTTADEILTEEQLNQAMSAIYWYRADLGLEFPIMFRRRQLDMLWYDEREWSMCSDATKDLAVLYTNYMMYNCCDDRPMNYYPLLDRIEEWMDSFYGGI